MVIKRIFLSISSIVYVLLTFHFSLLSFHSFSQGAAINATGAAANNSAMLDISATNQGMRIPRVALISVTSASPVTNPVNSLLVYDSATVSGVNGVSPGYYYWDTTATPDKWVKLVADVSGSNGWLTNGNAGTDSTVNFIGTTDNKPLVIKTCGAEKMRIMANGKVGIGTTTPVQTFEVSGGANNYQLRIGNGAAGAAYTYDIGRNNSTGFLNFYGNQPEYNGYSFGGVDRTMMSILNNGNVGIGTASPGYKLNVQDIAGSTFNRDVVIRNGDETNYHRLSIGYNLAAAAAGVTQYGIFILGEKGGGYGALGGLTIGTNTDAPFIIATNGAEVARINSSGNVGIGTTSPRAKLDVNGPIIIGSGSAAYGGAIVYDASLSPDGLKYYDAETSTWRVLNSGGITYSGTLWGQSGSNIYYNSGSVGIGTSTPDMPFVLVNNQGFNSGQHGLIWLGKTDDNGGPGLALGYISNGSAITGYYIRTGGNSGNSSLSLGTYSSNQAINILDNGDVGIGTTTPASKMDINGAGSVVTSRLLSGGSGVWSAFRLGRTAEEGTIAISAGLNQWASGSSAGDMVFRTDGTKMLFADGPVSVPLVISSGNVGIGTSTPTDKVHISGVARVSGDGRTLLTIRDNTPMAAGVGGGINFGGYYSSTDWSENLASIKGFKENATDGNYAGALAFVIRPNGSGLTEAMRITSFGKVGIGTTSPNDLLDVQGGNIRNSALAGTGSRPVVADANGVLSAPATGGSSFTPSITLSTLFESAGRFNTQNSTNATATYGSDGLTLYTSSTQGSYVRSSINTAYAASVYALSPTYSAQILVNYFGTDVQAFFGFNYITASGSGITYTSKHIGFKVVRASSGTAYLYATQANGTAETASAPLTALTNNDEFTICLKKNGETSVDYYWRLNDGPWSSATNLSTNMPTADNVQITHVISNANVATSSTFRIEYCSYTR
ncbi:MAG: hypothetical protein HGB12_00435 [Bacteroidetes bacterium]|nr:hypothetical protein [Bacteroidota bacterium]